MHQTHIVLILTLGLGAYIAYDLVAILRTGRTGGKSDVITRKQPTRFRRHIYTECAILALCLGMTLLVFLRSP